MLKTEEKGSDVNLATYLLLDGFQRDYELAAVISNDSDLVHPIEVVRRDLELPVWVINPHRKTPSWALRNAASAYRSVREGALRSSQFPETLQDRVGELHKPPSS